MPKRTDIHSVLIIGAGPIIIGQACEFDYSGTQACKALREEGYRVILVNSNPATIMTDPEFADRTYIEPITPECVEKIIVREVEEMKTHRGAKGKLVLLPTLGGQTALNTAMALHRRGALEKYGIEMIGANAEAIRTRRRPPGLQGLDAVDRPRRAHQRHRAQPGRSPRRRGKDRPLPAHHPARRSRSAAPAAASPTTARNSTKSPSAASTSRPSREILIEESLLGWKEYEMEVMRDKRRQLRHHLLHRKFRSRWASTPAIPSPSRPSRR